MELFDLNGRVAVVTGGNGGIGLGLARGLAKAGAALSIWGRNEEKNAAARAELEAFGARAHALRCDVSKPEEIANAVEATVQAMGRIDIGFANAGFGTIASSLTITPEEWQQVTAVDLDGAFFTFRELAKHMKERGEGGKLIGIGSIGEIYGMPRQAAYSASKGALAAMIRSLAVELARYDIQVNLIQPGWIETDATGALLQWEAMDKTIRHRTPARRWGTPEDLEGIAVYLASDASRFHTGDTIRVDGGYSVF
ncbi:MAG: 2-deoxy-D-gluconate 3-dehydrogenase [Deltaproteobacteria bacterium]|jgi:NAD(P)-dependent dehydrogenase (short-subunit alcohol dehydrogenase family)|nr:2-deoxy-D-gluconate 3-dehydrogenase [Deltaproteobacteria bacterium]